MVIVITFYPFWLVPQTQKSISTFSAPAVPTATHPLDHSERPAPHDHSTKFFHCKCHRSNCLNPTRPPYDDQHRFLVDNVILVPVGPICNHCIDRSRQLLTEPLTAEAIQPVKFKLSVDAEFLKYAITSGFIKYASSYATFTVQQVHAFSKNCSKESKTTAVPDKLDKLVKQNLPTNMAKRGRNRAWKTCSQTITHFCRAQRSDLPYHRQP